MNCQVPQDVADRQADLMVRVVAANRQSEFGGGSIASGFFERFM